MSNLTSLYHGRDPAEAIGKSSYRLSLPFLLLAKGVVTLIEGRRLLFLFSFFHLASLLEIEHKGKQLDSSRII